MVAVASGVHQLQRLFNGYEAHLEHVPAADRRAVADYLEGGGRASIWPRSGFRPDRFDPGIPLFERGNLLLSNNSTNVWHQDPSDLRNLQFFQPKEIIRLLQQLEALAESPDVPYVTAMIGTGGTIAMYFDAIEGHLKPGLDVGRIVKFAGSDLDAQFGLGQLEFPTAIDSSQMEIDYMADVAIAKYYIWLHASENLRRKLIGFQVCHGTDSMEFSSAFSTFMDGPDAPFSTNLVCSQHTTEDPFPDAGTNVMLSCHAQLTFFNEHCPTSCVISGGHAGGAFPAHSTSKVTDEFVTGLTSLAHQPYLNFSNFAEAGVVSEFMKDYRRATNWRPIIMRGYTPIEVMSPVMGDDPNELVRRVEDSSAQFILIQALGTFTLDKKDARAIIKPALRKAAEKGMVVFSYNPFPEGSTAHKYEAADFLRKEGGYAVQIRPQALRAKIMLALCLFDPITQRKEFIDFICYNNYVGEQPPRFWESIRIKSEDEVSIVQVGTPHEVREVSTLERSTEHIDEQVEVLQYGHWYAGVIEDYDRKKGYKVHYLGYPRSHDEWVNDIRLRARTYWDIDQRVEVSYQENPQSRKTWYSAKILARHENDASLYRVRYTGYDEEYDEWVKFDRIRLADK